MSNRTDFEALASELVEMFGLDPDAENPNTGKLQWRIERELHNAFVAGQESSDAMPAPDLESRLASLRAASRPDEALEEFADGKWSPSAQGHILSAISKLERQRELTMLKGNR